MNIDELYDAYAGMEQLPVNARTAEAAAAKRRSEALARLDDRVTSARQSAEAAKERLRTDLRAEAKAASSKGAIPKGGTSASGAQPNFSRVRSLREKLEGLLADKSRAAKDLHQFLSDLHALEKQIEEELRRKGQWNRAKSADVITYGIAGVAVLVSLVAGPGALGVGLLLLGLVVVGIRLFRGPSASMMRAAQKRPAVESHGKTRLGRVMATCAWAALLGLILNLVATPIANTNGLTLSLGSVSRGSLDVASFLGIAGAILVAGLGHRVQKDS